MAEPKKSRPEPVERESHESGIVSPLKNEILEQHYREHPEGDPAVRRIRPERGRIYGEDKPGAPAETVREEKEKAKGMEESGLDRDEARGFDQAADPDVERDRLRAQAARKIDADRFASATEGGGPGGMGPGGSDVGGGDYELETEGIDEAARKLRAS